MSALQMTGLDTIVPGIEPLARLVAERAVNSLAGGVLIAAIAWLLLRIAGKQSAGTRFAVWFCALIAIAGLPFVPAIGRVGAMPTPMHAEVVLPAFWAVAIFTLWITLFLLAAARMLMGLWKLRRLRVSGTALGPSQLHPALRETLAQGQAKRPVKVCSSSAVSVPTAIGFFQPAILIPEWAVRDLPVEELQIILLHEFAHLQRRDDWTNLIQKLVRTVFIFHPAVWWIEKRLSIEREMACDDAVLAATHNPRAYAECLVSLAERNFVRRSLALAQAAISRACETRARLARILDADTPHATKIFKPALGLMAGLLAACLVALPGAPRLVTFENGRPQNSVAATGNLANAVPALSPTNLDPNDVTATGSALAVPAVYRLSNGPGLRSDVAKFKPAKFHQPSTLQKPARKKLTAKQVPVTNRNNEEVSHTVLAADTIPAPIAPAPEFFFVMQTADFDQHGSVVVSLTVWKVTFAAPDAAPMNANQIQQILARFI